MEGMVLVVYGARAESRAKRRLECSIRRPLKCIGDSKFLKQNSIYIAVNVNDSANPLALFLHLAFLMLFFVGKLFGHDAFATFHTLVVILYSSQVCSPRVRCPALHLYYAIPQCFSISHTNFGLDRLLWRFHFATMSSSIQARRKSVHDVNQAINTLDDLKKIHPATVWEMVRQNSQAKPLIEKHEAELAEYYITTRTAYLNERRKACDDLSQYPSLIDALRAWFQQKAIWLLVCIYDPRPFIYHYMDRLQGDDLSTLVRYIRGLVQLHLSTHPAKPYSKPTNLEANLRAMKIPAAAKALNDGSYNDDVNRVLRFALGNFGVHELKQREDYATLSWGLPLTELR
jgi:hypothetical protein